MANSYQLLYDLLYSRKTVPKQRFTDWFMGLDLTPRWTKTNHAGAGTFRNADAEDEGYEIISGGTAGNYSSINFNNKRQISYNSSVFLSLVRRVSVGAGSIGLVGVLGTAGTFNRQSSQLDTKADDAFKKFRTADGSTENNTASDVAENTNWTLLMIELTSTNNKMHLDGILKVTKTTPIPSVKLQPSFLVYNSAAAATLRFKFVECWNV